MTKETKAVTPPFEGILDLDEPDLEAPKTEPEAHPAPEWSGDELLQIDVKGNIHVRGGRFFTSRVVGKVGGEDGEAVVGMLVDRFKALEDRWLLLKKEVAGSHNMVRHLKSLRSYVHWVEGAKAIGDFESLLTEAYDELQRIETELSASRSTKEKLIAEAEGLAESTAWRSTAETMAQLMEQWKHLGAGGSDEDEALWNRFKAARTVFFDRRSEHTADLKQRRRAGEQGKLDLIEKAQALADSTDWDATFDAMQVLMEQWKEVPSAGRRQDEELWQRFRAAREPFFEARKVHFADQRRQRDRRPKEGGGARQRPRPPRGREPSGHGAGRRPGAAGGSLHASLAELVGPLKDLFPDRKDDDK